MQECTKSLLKHDKFNRLLYIFVDHPVYGDADGRNGVGRDGLKELKSRRCVKLTGSRYNDIAPGNPNVKLYTYYYVYTTFCSYSLASCDVTTQRNRCLMQTTTSVLGSIYNIQAFQIRILNTSVTSNVKAFKRYRITDISYRQTNALEIIYHAASRVVIRMNATFLIN